MINTSAPLFGEETYRNEISRQQAELYSRLYAYAAEDFVAHPDLKEFVTLTIQCIEAMQKQLTSLNSTLSTHTHNVPPHTHAITPHTHICPSGGGPSSPNVVGMITQPTPLHSEAPVQSGAIKWNLVSLPVFVNTTGTIENLEGNKVIEGPTFVGPADIYRRRLKTQEILNTTVSIPPLLKVDFN